MLNTRFWLAKSQSNTQRVSVLFFLVFLDNLGYAIIISYLFYYAQSLGASSLVYGFLLASYSLMSVTFTPIISRLSDRYGRRRILLVALSVSSFSYFLLGAAQVLWLLFVSRMMSGTTAATVPVAQAYAADLTDKKERLRVLGLLGSAASIAFILGPGIGGVLSGFFGYAVPAFLASGLALTNLIFAYFRLPEPKRPKEKSGTEKFSIMQLSKILRTRRISTLLTIYFIFFIAFMFLQALFPPWLQKNFGFGPLETGLMLFYVGIMSAFTQAILLPKLSNRTSRSNLVLYGAIVMAVGFLALGILPYLAPLLLIAAIIPIGFGMLIITINTLISTNAPSNAQGGTLGAAQSIAALAQAISPIIATSTFAFGSSIGFAGLAFVVSSAIALSIIPLIGNFRKMEGRSN